MRSKVTLVLLFLNVALFFFIFYFERDWRIERASHEARRRVLGPEAANIKTLEVTGATPETTYAIERRGDAWFLTKPVEWPANPNAVSHILNELQFLEHETSFSTKDLEKNGQKLADYGLEQPKTTLAFTSGGESGPGTATPQTTVLKIGDTTKVGDHLYLLSNDGDTIHVVSRSLADSLAVSFDQLRLDTIFTIQVFEAQSLNLQTAAPSSVRVRLDRDRESGHWMFRTPVNARAGKNATELTLNDLDGLRVKSFVLQNPPSSPPAASPVLRITIEGNNRHQTLFVGTASDEDNDYYAQLEDRGAVFTVNIPAKLMDTLKDAADELRDRQILDFDPGSVSSIALSALNQPEISLQRLESPAAGHEAGWQITRRGGAQGAQTLPADAGAVQRLLEKLETLNALRFQSDAPTNADIEGWGFNRPEREIKLTLRGTPSTEVTLQIGLPTKRENVAYARIAGLPSVYAVEPDILKETSASPLAWRERLLSSLPAAARITSVSLTNAADNSVVYTHTLAGNETWETALASETGQRREAIMSLLAQLRTLKAASFVQDGFPDKVFAAGEVRSWKYRLDATISLPGGTGPGQVNTMTLWFAERTGGTEQLAGSKDFGAVFQIEQPLLDALFTLTRP
ncbi:MAG TPA: DUF4340 domain-containing protein [Opitutaceae bacterium]|jgi:hypothetical protein|nr:DUF4340 domain-containing protein [Opitutaceae bacterium]